MFAAKAGPTMRGWFSALSKLSVPFSANLHPPSSTPTLGYIMSTLPRRKGDAPKTNYGLPHQQLDQNPPADVYERLKGQAFDFPFCAGRLSRGKGSKRG
jgi:hypothetical protein